MILKEPLLECCISSLPSTNSQAPGWGFPVKLGTALLLALCYPQLSCLAHAPDWSLLGLWRLDLQSHRRNSPWRRAMSCFPRWQSPIINKHRASVCWQGKSAPCLPQVLNYFSLSWDDSIALTQEKQIRSSWASANLVTKFADDRGTPEKLPLGDPCQQCRVMGTVKGPQGMSLLRACQWMETLQANVCHF